MNAVLTGVIPVFALIALGWLLKRYKFLPDDGWPPIERLAIYVFYPGYLVPTIWDAKLSGISAASAGVGVTVGVLLIGALTLLAKPFLKESDATFTSIFQGTTRWNAFVGLPVVTSVFGQEGLAVAAIVISTLIPTANVMSVTVMARWGEGQGGGDPKKVFMALARNPILLSCFAGLALNLLHVPHPGGLFEGLKLLGAAALPLGLVIVGAGLSFRYMAARPVLIGAVTLVKLVGMPILMMQIARLMGADALTQGVVLVCGASPGAAASYVLARQMGGDAPLMAGVIAATTVGSALTMPLLLGAFGLG